MFATQYPLTHNRHPDSPDIDIKQQRSAAQQVLDTAELMEMIFLELPMRNLFTVQTTSKTFRDAIQSSLRLRRKMFLEPEPATAGTPAIRNPLLFAEMLLPGERDDMDPDELIAEYFGLGCSLLHLKFRPQNQFLCAPCLMETTERTPGESWRQMLAVRHPPAAKITVTFGGRKDIETFIPDMTASFGSFVTFGALYEWMFGAGEGGSGF